MVRKKVRASNSLRLGIAIAVGITAIVFLSPIRFYRDVSPKTMKVAVDSELPIGTDKSKVIAFLDARRIEHSGDKAGDGKIYAVVRDACLAAVLECTIDMTFSFDANGKLANASVKEGLTSL